MRAELGAFLVWAADNWPWAVVLWAAVFGWFLWAFGRTTPFSRKSRRGA